MTRWIPFQLARLTSLTDLPNVFTVFLQNLLLGEDGLVKIADFGISQMLSASGQKLADAAGTPAFMSPELCEGKSFSGQLADIWAIGATMFMLRFGHPPFLAKSIINLYHKICNDPLVFPGPIDPGLRNLLENMLEKDPNKRYTLQQIIMHPWFRHPPAVHAAQQQLRGATAQGGGQGQGHSQGQAPGQSQGGAATQGSDRSAASQQANPKAMSTAGSAHSFMPPDSYAAEEEAAMKVPVKIEHNDEVYMSIGGIQKPGKSGPSHHSSDGKIDEEGKNSEYNSENEGVEDAAGENMMNTDWGADVFQMIDDGDNSDNNIDDDSVDEDSDAETSDKFGDSGKKQPFGSDGSLMATRTEMTAEEGEKRAKRFKAKIAKKSNEDMELDKRNGSSHDSSQSSATSPSKSRAGNSQAAGSFDALSVENLNSSQNASRTAKLPFKSVSTKAGPRSRGDSIRCSTASRDEYDNEDADEVSMEDLSKIMDTLAMQPKNFSNMTDEGVVAGGLLPIEGFSAEILNKKNGMAAAFNSEKGCRHTQEDRCVLLPNAAQVKGGESGQLDASRLELLSQFSIGCIFDGHSGWRCAQYLSQHFVPTLVGHPRFLDKNCEAALTEVCAEMDSKVSCIVTRTSSVVPPKVLLKSIVICASMRNSYRCILFVKCIVRCATCCWTRRTPPGRPA
jgi:serine/threonine protein kinase